MQMQVEIAFDELVQVVKQLPTAQWLKLKQEVEKSKQKVDAVSDLEGFLLNAPTLTEEQISEIADTRKALNQWRKA